MPVLCPYCGHTQPEQDRCRSCKGLFDRESRLATQISMGPWYLRIPGRPYMPGCSFEVIEQRIKAGKLHPDTVLRGPTTYQFWSYAHTTPGVAHLLGKCHNCQAHVNPNLNHCRHCDADFLVGRERNVFGTLDSSPANAMLAQREINPDLCPACGQAPVEGDKCEHCGTVFAPLDAVVQSPPGPWALHDANQPFHVGYTLEEIGELIHEEEVTAKTILRGPTANQFWSIAGNTQGIGQLFGQCYSCHQPVDEHAEVCDHCHASFLIEAQPGELGLMFKTDGEAHAAQARLDEHLANLTAKQREAKEDPRQNGMAIDHAPGEAPVFDLDPPASDGGGQAAASQTRRSRQSKRQSTVLPLVLAGFVPVVLIVVLIAVMNQGDGNGGDGGNEGGDGNGAIAAGGNGTGGSNGGATSGSTQTATREQIDRAADLAKQYQAALDIPPTQKFAALLEKTTTTKDKLQAHWNAQRYAEAAALFDTMQKQLDAIDELRRDRDTAFASEQLAADAANEAQRIGIDRKVPDAWNAGQAAVARGKSQLQSEAYREASQSFGDAIARLEQAEKSMQASDKAKGLQKLLLDELTANFPRAQLEADGGEIWQRVNEMIESGGVALVEGRFSEAAEEFEGARALIPELEQMVRRVAGTNYFAFTAGYLSTHLLLDHASGISFDSQRKESLIAAFEDLRLNTAFIERVPADADVSYGQLAEVLVNEARKQIESIHGPAAAASYNIGFQFRLLERLLQGEGGILTQNDRAEIERTLKIIEREGETAGYSSKIRKFCEMLRLNMTAEKEYEAVKLARETLREMLTKLSDYDTAMVVVTGSGQ